MSAANARKSARPGREPRFRRAHNARAVAHRSTLSVLGTDGRLFRFEGDAAAVARALLGALGAPRTRAELSAAVARRFKKARADSSLLDETLDHLRAAGAVLDDGALPQPRRERPRPERRLVLGLTGAVATCDSPTLVRALQRRGFVVRCALTRAATRFVRPRVLEALTHEVAFRGLWDRSERVPVPHINLAEWADAVLVCPTSATTLLRIASGDCSDLVSAIAISTRAPVVLMPSMNSAMYESPSVRRNVDRLRRDGFHMIQPGYGHEVADRPERRALMSGVMLPPEDVATIVEAVLELATPPRRPRRRAKE
jgi:phosphopantothenoylcysteine decarboxylase/phosphopantothenate--cysteine ligase